MVKMLAFLADENFNGLIVRGVLRRLSALDLVRVQDVGLSAVEDPGVLEWAADHGRILLTHDVRTVTRYAYERVAAGLPMPGVLEVKAVLPVRAAIEEIVLVAECSAPDDWNGLVRYLPL